MAERGEVLDLLAGVLAREAVGWTVARIEMDERSDVVRATLQHPLSNDVELNFRLPERATPAELEHAWTAAVRDHADIRDMREAPRDVPDPAFLRDLRLALRADVPDLVVSVLHAHGHLDEDSAAWLHGVLRRR